MEQESWIIMEQITRLCGFWVFGFIVYTVYNMFVYIVDIASKSAPLSPVQLPVLQNLLWAP